LEIQTRALIADQQKWKVGVLYRSIHDTRHDLFIYLFIYLLTFSLIFRRVS